MLRAELTVPVVPTDPAGNAGLRGSGLIAVNPPWTLYDELKVLLPALGRVLSRGAPESVTVHWLAGESSR